MGLVAGAALDPGGERGSIVTVLMGMMGAGAGAVLGGIIGTAGASD